MSDQNKTIYDVIIIGAGPAGLTAGLYAARRTLKTLILGRILGGQATLSPDIENYPGLGLIDGYSLMKKFAEQAKKAGAEILFSEAREIKKQNKDFLVKTANGQYLSKAIILAFGLEPRNLNIEGEKKFRSRGVSYCATCDGPLYKGKVAAVVGGGNSALDAAEYLAKIAAKVYLIHRRDEFRGERILVSRVKKNPKIECVLSSEIIEIKGDKSVKSIVVRNNGGNDTKEITADGIFIEIGYQAKTEFIKDLVKLNVKGEIAVSKDAETSAPGIFAAGDVTDTTYKQIIISAGEGAKAALQAYKFLCLQRGEHVLPDWEKRHLCE